MEEMRNTYKLLVRKPDRESHLGRARHRERRIMLKWISRK